MIKPILAGAILTALMCGYASAGEIDAEGKSFPQAGQEPHVALSSSDLDLKEVSQGRWTFSFKSTTAVIATLDLTAQSSGYDPFSMEYTVPFYWDGPSKRAVSAAVVNDELNDAGLLAFFKSIGGGPTTLNANVLTHQRAKRLWKKRYSQLSAPGLVIPNGDDVKVAYWLLATMRHLVERQGAVVDDASSDAATWLIGLLKKERNSERLFNPQTATADEVRALTSFLGARDAYIYNRLVQTLEERLPTNRVDTCEKIRTLNEFLYSLPFDDRTNYDGQFGNSIKIKDDLLFCIRKEIASSGLIKSDVKTDDIDRARTETQNAQSALQEAENANLYSAPRALLAPRIRDMQTLLDNFERTNGH